MNTGLLPESGRDKRRIKSIKSGIKAFTYDVMDYIMKRVL